MDLSLQLSQKQVLSQRMQQSVEILQMNTLALSEYAKTLAEENPLLEWNEEAPLSPLEERGERLLQKLEWLRENDEQNRGGYRLERENESERENNRFGKKDMQSLREYLLFQINILKGGEQEKRLLRFLAESTEESGYLEQGALDAAVERYHVTIGQAEEALCRMQALDPPGVGARDLRECLLLQLRQKQASPLACRIAGEYLGELAKNRLGYIAKQLKVSAGEIHAAAEEIRSCEPKPGRGFSGGRPVEYVVPDVLVERDGEALTVVLNSFAAPRLRLSHSYIKLLRQGADAGTQEYIANKMKQAEWALQCIAKRESTLQQTAGQIVERQKEFFLRADGQLQPLRMTDVAQAIGVHESTVSRAVKDKYLQCDRGVFPLGAFFSKALAAEGEASVSAASIRQRLRALIGDEDKAKPLSDRELTEHLQAEGVQISRRTVAKYREGMGIAGAAGRKRY